MSREALGPYVGQIRRFTAKVDRIGLTTNRTEELTVLLLDVHMQINGSRTYICDHVWIPFDPDFESDLKFGHTITFDAKVVAYSKGKVHSFTLDRIRRPPDETKRRNEDKRRRRQQKRQQRKEAESVRYHRKYFIGEQ